MPTYDELILHTATQANVRAARANPAVHNIANFAGANDAAKVQAALTYAAAQTNRPALQVPAGGLDTGTTSFQMFDGMRIIGAAPAGVNNVEIDKGKGVGEITPGVWKTQCGSGASSLFNSSTTTFGVSVSYVSFWGTANNQSQIFSSTSNLYSCRFTTLTGFGLKHFFGSPTSKFLMTQAVFTGHWQVNAPWDTQFTLGGSDSSLWQSGYLNIGSSDIAAGAGKPLIIIDWLGKSTLGYVYATCHNDWAGVRFAGGDDYYCYVNGGVYEGISATNLATRPLWDITSGNVTFNGTMLNYVSGSSGTVQGAVIQSGGKVDMSGIMYKRGTGVADTFPMLYQTGGTARIVGAKAIAAEQVRARWSNGTVVAAPTHANSLT